MNWRDTYETADQQNKERGIFLCGSFCIKSIERVALTYVAIRAENKQDSMVFAPVWQMLFKEEGCGEEYSSWAEFNAISGTLIDAIFR